MPTYKKVDTDTIAITVNVSRDTLIKHKADAVKILGRCKNDAAFLVTKISAMENEILELDAKLALIPEEKEI